MTTATDIIREQAARHAESAASIGVRHVLLPREEGYVHPFEEVYYPPVPAAERPTAEQITGALGAIVGEANFETLVSRMVDNKDVQRAVTMVTAGGKVALLGDHRELFDTCAMQAGFLVSADRIAPGCLSDLIQGTRIFVGPIMGEMAVEGQVVGKSSIEALSRLGGVFKIIPKTRSTQQNIEKGLDPGLVRATNFAAATRFRYQSRDGEIRLLALAPTGTTNLRQQRADGQGEEYVISRVEEGTAGLLRYFHLLPVALQLGEQSDIRIGELVQPQRNVDLPRFLSEVMVPLCCELEGPCTRYGGESTD